MNKTEAPLPLTTRGLGWLATQMAGSGFEAAIAHVQARDLMWRTGLSELKNSSIDAYTNGDKLMQSLVPTVYSRIDRLTRRNYQTHVEQVISLAAHISEGEQPFVRENSLLAAMLHDFGAAAPGNHAPVSWAMVDILLPRLSELKWRQTAIKQAISLHSGGGISALIGRGYTGNFHQRRELLRRAMQTGTLSPETLILHAADKLALTRSKDEEFPVKMEVANNVKPNTTQIYVQSNEVPMEALIARLNDRSSKIWKGLHSLLGLYQRVNVVQFNIASTAGTPSTHNVAFTLAQIADRELVFAR